MGDVYLSLSNPSYVLNIRHLHVFLRCFDGTGSYCKHCLGLCQLLVWRLTSTEGDRWNNVLRANEVPAEGEWQLGKGIMVVGH